tara:strand:- start:8797 stop:10032 length:1236 start_codon:yes stop_codon:yes gene_type:complete
MSNSVPQGWSLSTIGDTCDVLDSKRIPLNSQDRALRQGIYPYYGANGVQGYIDDFIFEGEHVLLAEDGGYFDEWDSRPISYLVTGRFWVNNHAHILKAKRGHETRYVHYSLVHTNILKHINGGTRAKLNQSDMREIAYLTPPLPEQKKIAAILSSVDDLIEKTRAQIDKLKDLKTGMMQELLTKGIGSDGIPHTEFKDSPVGRIPVSWNVVPCGDVCNKITDGEHLSPKYVDKGLPILSAKDMRDYGIDLEGAKFVSEHDFAKMLKRCKPEYGDVLIVSRGATIGKTTLNTSRTPFALMGSVILLKPNQKCLGEFLSLFIASPFVQQSMLQLSGSSAQQAIYLKDIKDMPTPIPPIAEQKKIAHSITSIDSRIQALTHKLNASERLKKAVMQDLLTGKVRVKIDQKESAVA